MGRDGDGIIALGRRRGERECLYVCERGAGTGMREGGCATRTSGEGEYKTREEGVCAMLRAARRPQYLLRRLRRSVKHAQHVVNTPRNRHANAATVSHVPVS